MTPPNSTPEAELPVAPASRLERDQPPGVRRRARSQALSKLPTVVSVSLHQPAPDITSYYFQQRQLFSFGEASAPGAGPRPGDRAGAAAEVTSGKTTSGKITSDQPVPKASRPARNSAFQPPSDIVRIEDRLYYLLQPSLESLVETHAIDFPHDPFPYQYSGIAFLYTRTSAILADEMGLGKTMQAITAIRLLMLAGQLRNVLLICPKPLVSNWLREFRTWAGEIAIGAVAGNAARRRFIWSTDLPVTLCNYELITRDRPLIEDAGKTYDLVVVDEAQRIKNLNSATSKAVRAISRNRSWALTGTPVENSPHDLVGIFEFLTPGHLSVDMPLKQLADESRDHIIRRTKDQVLEDMPPKMIRDAELELTAEQRESYEQAESNGVLQLNQVGDHLTIQHVFELILRLKQICNFDPLTGRSSKLSQLTADLEEVIASGQKAIVFSQWVGSLEQIAAHIPQAHPLQFHGRIASHKRDAILEQFKNDPGCSVLLMSYGAGSVGLNLQFCRYVFLFDRWWNPAIEDQAINRAHRLGSTGSVTVTRFLTLDTIEERINEVLEAKRDMFHTLMAGTDRAHNLKLSREDIFGLFNLKTQTQRAA